MIPASVDVPHLIYRGEYFGAPIRNDADTVWMRERQLESFYRMRSDDRRIADEMLDKEYQSACQGRSFEDRAWMVGVARPRIAARAGSRMEREEARHVFEEVMRLAPTYANPQRIHPIQSVDHLNPKPGLRRWVAANTKTREGQEWTQTQAAIHFDGTVSLIAALGGARVQDGFAPVNNVDSARAENFVADLMALVRSASHADGTEYELRLGLEWNGEEPMIIQTVDDFGYELDGSSRPISQFIPITTTIQTNSSDVTYLDQIRDLELDVVNQGGIQSLRAISQPGG